MALNHACNCCEEPPCEAPVLEFISIEAECEVCGYALPVLVAGVEEDLEADPPVVGVDAIPPAEDLCLRFAKRTDSYEYVSHQDEDGGGTRDNEGSGSNVREMHRNEEWVCVERFFSGSLYAHEVLISGGDPEDPFYSQTSTFNTSAGMDEVWTGTFTYVVSPNSEDNDSYAITDFVAVSYSPDSGWTYTGPGVYTRSNPTGFETSRTETVEFSEPIETCAPTLPEYPAWEGESEDELEAGQGYETSAIRLKSGPCLLIFTQRSVKWRLKHKPTGTCYLKVWVRKVFTPTTGDPTATALPPYEWTGTGNPCLTDPALAADHLDNLIKGAATEETFPEEEGVTTFEILKYSCVEGYEPDITDEENPQPNGFPDPTWEAEPP